MKVTGPVNSRLPEPVRAGRPSSGFTLGASTAGPAPSAAATSAASGVAGVSALVALQGVEDATERRRRAMRRGHGLLDRLDELKLAALAGRDDSLALDRLAQAAREAGPEVEERGLAAVLNQIDLRAAVELAKRELRRSAA